MRGEKNLKTVKDVIDKINCIENVEKRIETNDQSGQLSEITIDLLEEYKTMLLNIQLTNRRNDER